MNRVAGSILLGLVILAMILAHLGRYGTSGTPEVVYVTDRWTGTTWSCQYPNCIRVYPPRIFWGAEGSTRSEPEPPPRQLPSAAELLGPRPQK